MSRGRGAAYKQTHARILLLVDESQEGGALKDEDIAQALKVGSATVERVRRRCVEEGVEAALGRRQQVNRRPRKLRSPRRSPACWRNCRSLVLQALVHPEGQRRLRHGRRSTIARCRQRGSGVLETSKQQVKETRQPHPCVGHPCPTCTSAMLFAPLEGWRRVEVTDRRTKICNCRGTRTRSG